MLGGILEDLNTTVDVLFSPPPDGQLTWHYQNCLCAVKPHPSGTQAEMRQTRGSDVQTLLCDSCLIPHPKQRFLKEDCRSLFGDTVWRFVN